MLVEIKTLQKGLLQGKDMILLEFEQSKYVKCHFVVFSLSNLLYIEIQMPRKLQLSCQNFLVNAKGIIIKKWWISLTKKDDKDMLK